MRQSSGTSPERDYNFQQQLTRLELFKQNHDIAFNFLTKGVEYDEKKEYEKARDYYREGIQCILQAERVPLSQQERYQAKAMLDKLQKHKTNFYNRMKEIDQILFDMQQQKQQEFNKNIMGNSGGGFFSNIMNLFSANATTTSSNSTTQQKTQVLSEDTRRLTTVDGTRQDPIYNHYTTNSQVLRSFPGGNNRLTSSANGKETNSNPFAGMYNSVNICDGLAQQQAQPPVHTRKRSSSNEQLHGHVASSSSGGGVTTSNVKNQNFISNNMTQSAMPSFSQHQQQTNKSSPLMPYQPANTSTGHNLASIRNNLSNNDSNNIKKKASKIDQIPEFKGVDRKLLDHILNDVIESKTTNWDDIAGLKDAKQTLMETVVLPSLRPDLFHGLRAPCKGILLFGPPGTGKTMIARACASQCNATFFSISASSLVSKYHGEGEKLVKCLFAAARYLQPSVIFVDEIDSILSARSSEEHEASRRMKTEFMVQMEGVSNTTGKDERVLVMGATNIPDSLDEAILRRFTKRIYIPLPDFEARFALIKHLSSGQNMLLSDHDIRKICEATEGFSGSDLTALCKETAMIPIREISVEKLMSIDAGKIRSVVLNDFMTSLSHVRPSTSHETITKLEKWNAQFGTSVNI
ncbi:hypothetical protein FDP41_000802 [Naegleria fowleri]|uniref:microtubule-severing ATPase n=1 Tax=Naegleria fowleri TaxID=5763 RepID=A0A6A5C3C5_NAEFO|nr:uncharacterized protein FDP41_000802 [Naegleria fowleri]KAF0984903.1 hypothetical protein FDP41_000802 [Naegleria fowleri]